MAKVLRIHPITWEVKTALRVELIGFYRGMCAVAITRRLLVKIRMSRPFKWEDLVLVKLLTDSHLKMELGQLPLFKQFQFLSSVLH